MEWNGILLYIYICGNTYYISVFPLVLRKLRPKINGKKMFV